MPEPVSCKYLYLNPITNTLHLMAPIIEGDQISRDNTCKSVVSLKEFFLEGRESSLPAIDHLRVYKTDLESDLNLLSEDSLIRSLKEDRLQQINVYIKALERLMLDPDILDPLEAKDRGELPFFPDIFTDTIAKRGNLYSMVLRPSKIDTSLRFSNPVFSVERDDRKPYHFFTQLNTQLDTLKVTQNTPRERYKQMVRACRADILSKPTDEDKFQELLRVMNTKFAQFFPGKSINLQYQKRDLDPIMGLLSDDFSVDFDDYVSTLITLNMKSDFSVFDTLIQDGDLSDNLLAKPLEIKNRKESLLIMIQFFIGEINLYAFASGKTQANFGAILDKNNTLSQELVQKILGVFNSNDANASVQAVLITFFNTHYKRFDLNAPFTEQDRSVIQERFELDFKTIDAIEQKDEFVLLYKDTPGNFVVHKGIICTDLSLVLLNSEQLTSDSRSQLEFIQRDFENIPKTANLPTDNDVNSEITIEQFFKIIQNLNTIQNKERADKLLLQQSKALLDLLDDDDFSRNNQDVQDLINYFMSCSDDAKKLLIQEILSRTNVKNNLKILAIQLINDDVLRSVLQMSNLDPVIKERVTSSLNTLDNLKKIPKNIYQFGTSDKKIEEYEERRKKEIFESLIVNDLDKIKESIDADILTLTENSAQAQAVQAAISNLRNPPLWQWVTLLVLFRWLFFAITATKKANEIERAMAGIPLMDRINIYDPGPDHIEKNSKNPVLQNLAMRRRTGDLKNLDNLDESPAQSYTLFKKSVTKEELPDTRPPKPT